MHRCPVGFIGKNCTVPCESNKYGPLCMNDCKCAKESTLNCNKGKKINLLSIKLF